jgi:dUTP pyrophosphatase
MSIEVNIVNRGKHALPTYATSYSAGVDLYANIDEPITLHSLERHLIPTGLYIELPIGYEAQIRPRSGNAFKLGLTVLNSPGTIDADYRGEIKILLVNLSTDAVIINDGERIAQMVITKHEYVMFTQVSDLTDTVRGAGGFGHTGIK